MPAYDATTNRTPGRRQRKHSSNNSHRHMHQKSMNVAEAKTKFVETIARGVTVLMEDCGYSRERATIALLREIARGDSSPPVEEEIFQTMHSHGLSMEAATRALTVSKALQRQIAERNISMVEAIDDLTSKLSLANLVRRESQSATPCDEDVPVAARIQPVSVLPPTTTHVRSKPTTTTTATPAITTPSARKAKANTKKDGNAKKSKPIHNNTATGSNANTAAGRKRTMEDINNNNTNQQSADINKPRERSDSVSEEVNAKLAENKAKLTSASSDDEGAANNRAVVPGAKRGRGVETNNSEAVDTPSMKRTRTSSDL